MATSSANTPSERWKTLYDLEEEIKNFRSQQDNAKAGIDKHRKRYEDIKQNLQTLPPEQQDQEKKNMKRKANQIEGKDKKQDKPCKKDKPHKKPGMKQPVERPPRRSTQ